MNPGFAGLSSDTSIAPANAIARLKLKSDGRTYQDPAHGSPTYGGNWFVPTTTGIGSTYSAKFVLVSGDTPTGVTLGTWVALSGEPQLTLTASTTGVDKFCELWVYIALTADTTTVLAQGFASLDASKT